jgi:hypothetical protein
MLTGKKGQAAAVDLMLVCICVSIFAIAIWTASMGGKAPESHALRARQDYVKSMLITTLYSTPNNSDSRYSAKSISDLFCMHLKNPEEMPIEIVIAKMKEAKIGEALKEKAVGSEAEWFIYSDPDPRSSSTGAMAICLHGKSGSDVVEACPPGTKAYAKISTAATAWIAVPGGGTGGAHMSGPRFNQMPIFLGVKWA